MTAGRCVVVELESCGLCQLWSLEGGDWSDCGDRRARAATREPRSTLVDFESAAHAPRPKIANTLFVIISYVQCALPRERRVTARVADPLPTRLETRVVARAVVSHCNAITQLILQPLPHPSPQPPPPHPIPPLPHVLVRVSARAELRGCCANAIGVPSACPRCATSQLLLCCYEKVECCATAFIKPSCHLS